MPVMNFLSRVGKKLIMASAMINLPKRFCWLARWVSGIFRNQLFNQKLPNFKKLQLGFQMSWGGTKKKENNLNIISKMMGTLVHVKLYAFSYRKAVIRPQNMPKTADWGQKRSKLCNSKMAPQVQPKRFWHVKLMINN